MERSEFGHIMVDIETMANTSYSSIVSIGAVEFNIDNGKIGKSFHKHISLQSCIDLGLKVSQSTLYWWLQQNDEARKRLVSGTQTELHDALILFSDFISACGGKDVQLWGNSARFDLGILSDAYDVVNMELPWNFRNERCVRTLVSFYPSLKTNAKKVGVEHDALDDCKFQINYCTAIWNKLYKNKS